MTVPAPGGRGARLEGMSLHQVALGPESGARLSGWFAFQNLQEGHRPWHPASAAVTRAA